MPRSSPRSRHAAHSRAVPRRLPERIGPFAEARPDSKRPDSPFRSECRRSFEAQLDQLYGCAQGIFSALAHNSDDATFYVFNKILKELRNE